MAGAVLLSEQEGLVKDGSLLFFSCFWWYTAIIATFPII